ncbi:MAG TPA: Spy/CpxP family protein refolding chaperone [Drouetiella sp.]
MFPFGKGFGKRCGGPWDHEHGRHGMFGGFSDLLQDLDLTDDQVERIAELKAEGMGEGMRMMSEGGQYFKQIVRELTKETIDKDKVREAHKNLREQKIKMGDAMLERALAVSETLTPEQRKKLKRGMQRRFLGLDGHRGGPGFGPGFGFGPGGPGGPGGRPDHR